MRVLWIFPVDLQVFWIHFPPFDVQSHGFQFFTSVLIDSHCQFESPLKLSDLTGRYNIKTMNVAR
jgi:hypothetical protein